VWAEAQGINAFRGITNGPSVGSELGVLQTSPAQATSVNFTAVAGTPMAETSLTVQNDSLTDEQYAYWITDEGFIGRTTAGAGLTTPSVTELRAADNSAALVFPGTGIETMRTTNSGTALFYFHSLSGSTTYNHSAAIGVFSPLENESTNTFNDTFATEYEANPITNRLQKNITLNRPTHKFTQKIFHAHGHRVGSISLDTNGDPVNVWEDLDLPQEQEATALEDDGDFLIIGSNTSSLSFDSNFPTGAVVWFWNTFDVDISREWPIKESHIIALKRVGNVIYALCPGGIWAFNYQTRPFKVLTISNSSSAVKSKQNTQGS
jgi:hypothetical protein